MDNFKKWATEWWNNNPKAAGVIKAIVTMLAGAAMLYLTLTMGSCASMHRIEQVAVSGKDTIQTMFIEYGKIEKTAKK